MAIAFDQFGYIAAFAGYVVLPLVYALWGRWGRQGYVFVVACLLTAIWAWLASVSPSPAALPRLVESLHHAASLCWILFLWMLVAHSGKLQTNYPRRIRLGWIGISLLAIAVLGLDLFRLGTPETLATPAIALSLLLSVAGLSLTETVFRSFQRGNRWGVKYLCLAVGGIFAFDVLLFADGLLYRQVDPDFLSVRGYVVASVIPLLVVNIFRAEARHLALALSARMVFGSTVVLATGLYLGLMALAAYYIRDFGGSWSSALQVLFIFGAVILLCAALLSGTVRSYIRNFLAEHLLRQKFDYRSEWRRLLQRISTGDEQEPLDLRVVKTLADLLDSPGGALWYLEDGHLSLATAWNVPAASIAGGSAERLAELFDKHDTVLDLRALPAAGESESPLAELRDIGSLRYLLPLLHHDSVMGVLALAEPRVARILDHEDRELVTMASRQAAGYLSEQRAARALAEAREFERFNQRYAFVTHDMKNLVSQLSLMLRNAEKHGSRPEFQQDMLETVRSAVGRMNHLMERLKDDPAPERAEAVSVKPLIDELVAGHKVEGVDVRVECPEELKGLKVRADSRRVDAILRHLLQNALEASGEKGSIVIGLRQDRGSAVIEVRDSGKGMDLAFIQSELFRPFRSTKQGGMGIGAFQCRAYARELGGDLEAISSLGSGTTMRVTLPVLREA